MKEGWKVVKLGEVCKIGIGRTPSRSDKSLWDNEKKTNNKWVSIADMTETLNGFIYETKEHISDKAANNIAVIPQGTILLSFKLTLGKTAIAGNDLYTNEAIANLPIITNEINKEYLLYYFQFFNWVNYAAGDEKVMGKTLNKKKLEILPVIYPPLPEQHRIVKKLDAALEKIDALKAKAEKNIENAKALFQQTLAEELEPKEGWVEKRLVETGCTQTGTTPSKKDVNNYGDYLPFIRPAEINCDGLGNINYDSEIKLSKEGASKGRLFKANSIFMVCIGATIGKVGISNKVVSCNQQINVITPIECVIPRYVYYAMVNKPFKDIVIKEGTSSQATLPIINKGKWEELTINIPSSKYEQQQIVTKLDKLSAKCKKLEEAERKTIAECDALKQAILRQAFNGEL